MATQRQKETARRTVALTRDVRGARARGARMPAKSPGLSQAEKNRMRGSEFAFADQRKEPINDARHVRTAIARFDQVEGVTDAERDRAWECITTAAKKFDVEVSARDWRERFHGGKAQKR